MSGSDLLHGGDPFRRMHHDWYSVSLCLGPEPVRRSISEPGPVLVPMERQPDAKHARLFLPSRKRCMRRPGLKRDATHHGETVGVLAGGFQGVVVAVAIE